MSNAANLAIAAATTTKSDQAGSFALPSSRFATVATQVRLVLALSMASSFLPTSQPGGAFGSLARGGKHSLGAGIPCDCAMYDVQSKTAE